MNELIKQEWYKTLIVDCQTIITERIFNSRWELILCKWEIGNRILEDESQGVTKLLTRVSVELGFSEREIWRCLSFRNKFPDINKLPEGKNISWRKIIDNYLPAPKEEKSEQVEEKPVKNGYEQMRENLNKIITDKVQAQKAGQIITSKLAEKNKYLSALEQINDGLKSDLKNLKLENSKLKTENKNLKNKITELTAKKRLKKEIFKDRPDFYGVFADAHEKIHPGKQLVIDGMYQKQISNICKEIKLGTFREIMDLLVSHKDSKDFDIVRINKSLTPFTIYKNLQLLINLLGKEFKEQIDKDFGL